MAIGALPIGSYKRLTATANVKSSQGAVLRVICASASSGTIALYNSATTTTTDIILNTTALVAGGVMTIEAAFDQGLYVVIGGTADITVVYV